MKPIILYVDDGDKVTISKAKLEKLIEDAYMQGKADGTVNTPIVPWSTPDPIPVTPTYPGVTQPWITWTGNGTTVSYKDDSTANQGKCSPK
jgi:hypothetical protein